MSYIVNEDLRNPNHPQPLGYKIREAVDADDNLVYSWVSPSGITTDGYPDFAAAARGAWVDHNTAVKLGILP